MIFSVSQSPSACTSATWLLYAITLPTAESRAPKGENAVQSGAVGSRPVVVESTARRARSVSVARREEAADDLRAADGGVHDGRWARPRGRSRKLVLLWMGMR